MDRKLLAWGLRGTPAGLPRLWLFTDDERLRDPRKAVANLPRGRAGVVFRHDAIAAAADVRARHDAVRARAALGCQLARICRQRRLQLVVAGDVRLAVALRAGVHLRGGRWPDLVRLRRLITSSAHSVAELRRAARAGAAVTFLSPAFPTASHAGTAGLGPLRWGNLAKRSPSDGPMRLGALGGVDGCTVRRLPARACQAVGAIGALATS